MKNTIFCFLLFWATISNNIKAQITGFDLKQTKPSKTYYVAVNGTGDGSKTAPLGSIEKAITLALQYRSEKGKSVKVQVAKGLYREVVSITKTYDNPKNALFILEGETAGAVTVTGSRPLSQWQPMTTVGDKTLYSTTLPDEYIKKLTQDGGKSFPDGEVPNPWQKWVKKRGGMFQNGLLKIGAHYYYPVPLKDTLVGGAFIIDYQKKKIFVRLDAKQGLEQAELAVEPTIFTMSNNNALVIRNMAFEHAGWSMRNAVSFRKIEQLLIENCLFNNNRYTGVDLHLLKNVTIYNVEMAHNGGKGGAGSWKGYLRNIILDKVKVNDNNWVNHHYAWYGWDPCGIKFSAIRQMIVRNSEFQRNYAVGFWFDNEFKDVTIDNTLIAYNFGPGIMIEASKGPITLTNCTMNNNDYGVYISAAEQTTLDNCTIYDNNFQIGAFDHWGKGRGHGSDMELDFPDIDTQGAWSAHAVNTVIKNCTIKNQSFNENALISPRYNDMVGYQNFLNTLKIENNKYEFGASDKTPFFKGASIPNALLGDWKEN
jgi:parallel beta-helix repeat protein